jgi:hypothetical protein
MKPVRVNWHNTLICMNRAVRAFGRFLLKDWDLLVFLVVAAGWERVTGVPFTVRTALSLVGCRFILSLLWGVSGRIYRDTIRDAVENERQKCMRVFVEDPEVVLELAKHSGYDAVRRFTPYLGKWIMLSGKFDGIAESLLHDSIHLSLRLHDNRRINLRFSIAHREQLLRLKEGWQITVIGKIEHRDFTFMPENCELIRVEPMRRVERFKIARAS